VKSMTLPAEPGSTRAIVKGEHTLGAGLPESFSVLVKGVAEPLLDVNSWKRHNHWEPAPRAGFRKRS